ncbi:MAG: hypothetical protein KBD64_07115 [Gammaproteobacteria bacterium]|nr:hypothetical protein [Gammaproteobacteria bacterium]
MLHYIFTSLLRSVTMKYAPGKFFHHLRADLAGKKPTYSNWHKHRQNIKLATGFIFFFLGLALGVMFNVFILFDLLASINMLISSVIIIATMLFPGFLFAEIGYIAAKQLLRLISWLNYRKDPNVVNPTNPDKYKADHIKFCEDHRGIDVTKPLPHQALLLGTVLIDQYRAQEAIRKLYLAKKAMLKPSSKEGDKDKKIIAIDYAIGVLRKAPLTCLFRTVSLAGCVPKVMEFTTQFSRENPGVTKRAYQEVTNTEERINQSRLEEIGIDKPSQDFVWRIIRP